VLNTRPREQAAELSRLLEQGGLEAVEAPAIDIVPAWDATELRTIRRELQSRRFDWVVLASANAAHDLLDELRECRVVCGAATARALGLTPAIALVRFSASAALDAMRPRLQRGQRVLLPRAEEGRDELILGLRALSAEVSAPVAYRTQAVDNAAAQLRAGSVDVVIVCSPSAVRGIASALPVGARLVCLGQTTADTARRLGLRVDAVADSTGMPALVDAVHVALARREVPA
jgi:uroporphyrinogen-III synthase